MFDNKFPPNTEKPPTKKILLAEDDNSVRRFIEIILQRANYEVLSAEDGLSAMKIASENKIHAVVSDAMMPNLTGYDLCRILKQNPQFNETPFIILSGFQNESEENQADAYLVKDNNLKENLIQTLSSLFLSKELQPS